MIKRKYFVMLLFLIIVFGAISQVSATNLNATDIIGDDDTDIVVGNATSEIISEDDYDDFDDFDDYDDYDDYDSEGDDTIGTFTDLANLISGGGAYTLTQDYLYDESVDDSYYYGIPIEDTLIIHGDNHYIYGTDAFRIFDISGDAVVYISDVRFVNNNYGYMGGAIYNDGYLVLENCIFSNFGVEYEGGAIYSSKNSILNVDTCLFMNCNAYYEDEAAGGAIASYGTLFVKNSYFTNCTSEFGGAILSMYESYISNSIFGIIDSSDMYIDGKNSASISGGAIYSDGVCEVSDCIFSNNRAESYGGAVYGAHVCNSYFDDNNIAGSDNGHNVAYGVVMNCTQADNYESNYYQTIISEGFVFKSDTLFFPKGSRSKTFDVNVTSNPTDEPVGNVEVAILVDDEEDYRYAATNDEGIASFQLPVLSDGRHSVQVELYTGAFSGIYSITYYITVGKVDSEIKFSTSSLDFNYGSSGKTNVYLTGCTVGSATVLNHPEAIVNVNNNVITVSGLNVGSYTLQVVSAPDSDHYSVTRTLPINVKKVSSSVTFNGALNFNYGSSASTSINVIGGSVQSRGISVENHPEAKISISNNWISVSNLNAGSYTLKVTTTPDANHNANTATMPITVNKVKSTISFGPMTFNSIETGTTTLALEGCSVRYNDISVVGQPKAIINLNNNIVSVSGLAAGTYTLSIVTTPDANHESSTGTNVITVTKPVAKITANSISVYLNSGKSWTIKVADAKGNPVANTKVTLNVYTGSSYRIYTVDTNAQGVATFDTASKLTAGTHKVVLNTQSDVYVSNPVTSSIKVIKPSTVKYVKVIPESKDGGTALTIKIKVNGKYVQGVKFKFVIYKGSKAVKTLNLKTKKVKNYCAIGYATNKLSKGTYTVKIIPYDNIKYSGSKTIKNAIKITKKGKWERKLTS